MLPDNYTRKTEYLVFEELKQPPEAKTRVWVIRSRMHDDYLGRVHWFGRWHQYVVTADAIFNKGCLEDIIKFLADAQEDWRERRANKPVDSTVAG